MADVQQQTGSNQLRGDTQTHHAQHFQCRRQSLSLLRFRGGRSDRSDRSAASEHHQSSQFWQQQQDNCTSDLVGLFKKSVILGFVG